ncbi:MAG: hypothetical protein R3240_07185 [Gammaproteobacteria bacterium]|nr:hypothetical protein [Gammaproteobacteria bacterium]
MKRIRPITLVIFSIAWSAYILSNSIDSMYHYNWHMILSKLDQRYVIENGIVPLFYMWMFYIFLRFLTNARYKPSR